MTTSMFGFNVASYLKTILTSLNFSQKTRDQSKMYKYVQLFFWDSYCTCSKNSNELKDSYIRTVSEVSKVGHEVMWCEVHREKSHVPMGWQLSDKGLSDVCQLSNEQIVGDWSDINLIITNSSHLTLIQPILRLRNFKSTKPSNRTRNELFKVRNWPTEPVVEFYCNLAPKNLFSENESADKNISSWVARLHKLRK